MYLQNGRKRGIKTKIDCDRTAAKTRRRVTLGDVWPGAVLALVCGNTNLHNQGDIRVVNTSGRHIAREHDGGGRGAELVADARAMRLALARVNFEHGDAHGVEELGVKLRASCADEEGDDFELRFGAHVRENSLKRGGQR